MKSLDSIDKSFEDRFDRKLQTISESDIRDFDRQKKLKQTSSLFRLEFAPSIPQETKLFLKENTSKILDFPGIFRLNILHVNHLIRFIDQETYESEIGGLLPKDIQLPASRFDVSEKKYKITIIIPKIIKKAEIVINITRNIFSKIFGVIFFNEQIVPLEFYKNNNHGQKKILTTIPEILDLLYYINFPSKILQSHCESFAKSNQLNLLNKNNNFKELQIEAWRKKWNNKILSQKEKHSIELIFSEFIKLFKQDPLYIYKSISKQIKNLNSGIHFILPHETSAYNNFEKNRFIHYIRVVKNKLEEINSLLGFIEEINSLLKKKQKKADLKSLGVLIRRRMYEMRSDKKVLLFYIPEIKNNPEMKNLKERFPLHLLKMLPRGTDIKEWSKEVKRLERNYINSIYSKIYSYLHGYSMLILTHKDFNKDNFLVSLEGKNLNKLFSVLKFKTNTINILNNNLGLLIETSEHLSVKNLKESQRHLIPLNDFGNAWNYFISSALTLIYYKDFANLDSLPNRFKSKNFLKSIMGFVEKQCAQGINHYHIVKLLWLIYERGKNYDLEFVIYCIKNPNNILRYTLYELMNPEMGNRSLSSRIEKLNHFGETIISVYQKQINDSKN